MRKIDKTLREVRLIKRKIGAKTRRMTTQEVLAYFHSAKREASLLSRKRRAA